MTDRRSSASLSLCFFARRDDFCSACHIQILWGRLVTCGRLAIGRIIFLIQNKADYQSAAGYQPAPHELRRSRAVFINVHRRTTIVPSPSIARHAEKMKKSASRLTSGRRASVRALPGHFSRLDRGLGVGQNASEPAQCWLKNRITEAGKLAFKEKKPPT